MTAARIERLQRVEARQPRDDYWRDPYEMAMALLEAHQAVQAGLACWMPQPEEPLSPIAQKQLDLAMRDADQMHERLMAEHAGEVV